MTLKPGEIANYGGYYIINNSTSKTALVSTPYATASSPGKTNNVTDTSDNGDDNDGNTTNDPTIVEMSPNQIGNAKRNVTDTNANSANDQGYNYLHYRY